MIIVVIDTNVILSAVLFGGKPLELLDQWRHHRRFDLAVSPELLVEILTKLRTKFAFPPDLIDEWRWLFESRALHALPDYETTVCRDPNDNMFIDTALTAKARYIVTGDKDLLDIRSYRNVDIHTVSEMIAKLENS